VLTQAKHIKRALLLLCSLFVAGSSNHTASIGFWQVLYGKANAVPSYWQFPRYFSLHFTQLPGTTLGVLARNKIPSAQYAYSLNLLKNNRTDAAKLYWRASVEKISDVKRQKLAAELLAQSRWGDLQLLAKQRLLPAGEVLNHFKLQSSEPYSRLTAEFLQQLGFLSLDLTVKANSQCVFNVLMMSDHRNGLYKLAEFIEQYNSKPEPNRGVFCFTQPIYVAGAVACQSDATKMAQCDWQNIQLQQRLPSGFDFIVMMTRHGSANVADGIMHLNSQAYYQMFLHELMHFNGFEDEYVLADEKQAWLCQQNGFVAPNLFIANSQKPPQGWYKSESCQHGAQAYKPSQEWSIMQYQQVPLSAQYRALWQAHINTHSSLFPRFTSLRESSK
jgi:hypothetical protein